MQSENKENCKQKLFDFTTEAVVYLSEACFSQQKQLQCNGDSLRQAKQLAVVHSESPLHRLPMAHSRFMSSSLSCWHFTMVFFIMPAFHAMIFITPPLHYDLHHAGTSHNDLHHAGTSLYDLPHTGTSLYDLLHHTCTSSSDLHHACTSHYNLFHHTCTSPSRALPNKT